MHLVAVGVAQFGQLEVGEGVGVAGRFPVGDDIDLLVVSESPHLEDLLDGLRQQVSTWSGNTAHVIGSTRSNFARLRADEEPIVGSWEREAQVLLGNPALLRRAAR